MAQTGGYRKRDHIREFRLRGVQMAYISEITPEMVQTVDKLKSSNFEGATQEEIETYGNWCKLMALHDAELMDRSEQRRQESEQRMELNRQQAQSAINALDALTALAQAKLKAVENES